MVLALSFHITHHFLHVKQFPCPIADAYLKELQAGADKPDGETHSKDQADSARAIPVLEAERGKEDPTTLDTPDTAIKAVIVDESQVLSHPDTPDVPLKPSEKKRLHWKGKTCLYTE